jgi:hypothetical protein
VWCEGRSSCEDLEDRQDLQAWPVLGERGFISTETLGREGEPQNVEELQWIGEEWVD